jgi:hypothetical protein
MSAIDELLDPIPIPALTEVRQSFEDARIASPEQSTVEELERSGALSGLHGGQRVALAVGSRGIADLPSVVRGVVAAVKAVGASPFIVPAMGSHGGATSEGQAGILAGLGVTEESVSAPVRATMETVQVGTSAGGLPVHIDRYAAEADGIILINRIHPHPAYRGTYESGLMKMIAIGLGKLKGANICHDLGFGAMDKNIADIAKTCLAVTNVVCGVAVLENAYHQVYRVEVVPGADIPLRERELLKLAMELEARFYFDQIDVLIMEEIGKNIAGSGFDTNIVGRYGTPFISGGPSITKMSILDVTEVSHGNCMGVGLADFTTRRLFDKFDFESTYPNSLTATVQGGVKIPMVLKNDKQAIQAAIKSCNIPDKANVRLVWLKNTLEIGRIRVSAALLEEAKAHANMEIVGTPQEIVFDQTGSVASIGPQGE